VTEGIIRLETFNELRKYIVASASQIIEDRVVMGTEIFNFGLPEQQYILQLANTENFEELEKTRFQNINLPDITVDYKNISSFLGSVGIKDLDSLDVDYISMQLCTTTLNHSISVTVDIKKLKRLKAVGVDINNTYEKFIYCYDTGLIIDDCDNNNLGNLMNNCIPISQAQQEGTSCWFNAAVSTIVALQNPDIIEEICSGNIQPHHGYVKHTVMPNALEVKQMLAVQKIADRCGVGKLAGGLAVDYIVSEYVKNGVIKLAKKEEILKDMEKQVRHYLKYPKGNINVKEYFKTQFKTQFETMVEAAAANHVSDSNITAETLKFQKALLMLDTKYEILGKLEAELRQRRKNNLQNGINELMTFKEVADLLHTILASRALDKGPISEVSQNFSNVLAFK
jgi:hypothetical protein